MRRLLAALVLLAGSVVAVRAASPADIGLAQFGIERWDSADGVGSNWVRALVEDPDGTVWIGTGIGLVRFDGREFTPVLVGGLAELPQRTVSALERARGGGVWVGLEHGGVRHVGARADSLPVLPDEAVVHDLLETADGSLWVATSVGVWRHAAGATVRITPPGVLATAEVRGLALAGAGSIWARSTVHGLWRVDGTIATQVDDVPGCLGFGITEGPDGERFMSCREGVWRWPADGSGWQRIADDFGVGPILLDRRGDLWFGSETGLARWSRGRTERLPPPRGLGDWRVRAFAEDRRGDVWIGTFSGGLSRLHRGPVRTFGAPEGVELDGTTAVLAAADGRVWVGAFRGGLLRFDPATGAVERWRAADGLAGETVWSLAADAAEPGALWIGGDLGLARFADGRVSRFELPRGVGPGAVQALHADATDPDTLWLAVEGRGLVAMRQDRVTVDEAADAGPPGRIRFLHRDRAGRLFCGGDAGLFMLDGARWVAQTPAGAALEALTAVAEHPDGSLWIASRRAGVLRIDGAQASLWGLDAGLPFWPVHSVAFDGQGGLWLSGNEGLARIRLDDYARWRAGEFASVPVERLARRDGLRDVETNGWGYPPHARSPDGRLVYPTAQGVALVDPGALPSVGLAPDEIRLHGAVAGTRALALDDPLRLGRGERALRIAFSATELLRPEAVSFRYRLDGVDADWIESGSTREAAWSPLPPGVHRFHLQARLPGQPWIDAASVVRVEVDAQLWESPLLRLAASAAALALLALAVAWRLRVGRRHAEVLARARTFLREVIDTSPNPIFVRRRDGAYSLANRAAAGIYGLGPDALEGRRPSDLGTLPPGMARVDALDGDVVSDGSEHVLPEQEIVDADGQRRWYRVVKRPGFGPDGRTVEQVIGTAVDVTGFKLAEQRLRRSREEARALSHRLLRAQEDERRRLAQEIHDDLTQQLAGLSMLAWSTAQAAAREPGTDRREALEALAQGLERLANDVQALSRELHPPALDALGLAEALRGECATFGQRTGLPIEFAAGTLPLEPPPEVGLALYRIAQEALRNGLAHARATRVEVTLEGDDTGVRLRIRDDGTGFDPAGLQRHRGLGLSGMRERARLAGASLSVESASGCGTTIEVDWRGRGGHGPLVDAAAEGSRGAG